MTKQVALQKVEARTAPQPVHREASSARRFNIRKHLSLGERDTLENELYFVITYLYGLATSYCSLTDMFNYVAQSEFKRCGQLFNRIKVLANTWNLGFVRALEETAKQVKSRLLKDFMERFSQMLKTGETYDRFLMMEHEAYVVAYEAEYERQLKSMENLGNAYSAIITSVTFVTITMTLTQALMGGNMGSSFNSNTTVLGIVLVATLLLSVIILNLVSPADKFIYINPDLKQPKEFTKLKRVFPLCVMISIAAAFAVYLIPSFPYGKTTGMILLALAIPLLPVGILAKRADDAVKARENAFPTFMRTLGTTAGITGYSTARTLKLLLVREFGVLSGQVRALHARLSIGVDAGLCWKNLASEAGSEFIRIFGGIYDATVSMGGDPAEIGKMISRNMIRRLVLRAKRIQVAGGIKAMIYPLHVIECALLSFMTSLLDFLVKMINVGAQYGSTFGIFQSSIQPGSIAPLFSMIMILMTIANAIALKVTEVSNSYRLFHHLAILTIMTGAVMLGVGVTVDLVFKGMFTMVMPS
jgi:flagellar protein FlaJ